MDTLIPAIPDSWIHRILRGDAAPRSLWRRMLCAIALFAVAQLLRVALLPPGGYVFSTFFPVVMASALLLGAVPGLLTLVLSSAAALYGLQPGQLSALPPTLVFPLVGFVLSSALICGVAHDMRLALVSLRTSELKFRALFAKSEIGIYRMDMHGRYLEFNEAFLRICGYTAEEIGALDYSRLTPPEYAAQDARQSEMLARTGRFGPYEKEYLRKDGSRVPVRLQGSVVNAPGGERYVWTLMEDITESRRMFEENARLLNEHRAVSESRVVGLVRVRNRMMIWANEAFAEMVGYTIQELVGQSTRMLYADDAAFQAFAATVYPAIRAGGSFRTEHSYVRKNGDLSWFEISCGPSGVAGDETVAAFVDVTQRRQALEEVRRSEARLGSIFAAMAEGLVVHATDGAIIDANPAAERLLGLTRDQLLGKTPMDAGWKALRDDGSPYHGEEHPAMVTLRSGVAVRDQVMGVQLPGVGLRWLTINAQPVPEADTPGAAAVIATFADVTAQRVLTQDLARARADLQSILDNMPARIAAWDQDYKARFINRGAAERFGMAPQNAVGRPVEEVIGAQRYRSGLPLMQAALAGKAQSQDRIEMLPDGTPQVMHVEYIPDVSNGRICGFYVLATDVTELTQSLGRIRDLAQRLETVREDERRSVALTLHEGIAQELFAARLTIRSLAGNFAADREFAAACQRLETVIDKCIADTKQVANDLRPVALSQVRLAAALALHAEYFGELAGLNIEVTEAAGVPDIDEPAKLVLFRAAQEALTNVARHARASHVSIALGADAENVVMRVHDDGVGLYPADLTKPGALGLLGIRERSATLGGTLSVTRDEHGGTTLVVTLPRHDA